MSVVEATVTNRAPADLHEAGLALDCKVKKILYGSFLAVRDSNVPIQKGKITGFIGPSGCGKSTVLRSLNRMNDLIEGFSLEGHVLFLARTSTARMSIPSWCGATSVWFSSSRTPSR